MAGRFDEQAAGVAGAGLGDRALPTPLAGRLLGRDQPDVAGQLLGMRKRGEVADLGDLPERGEGVDAARAPQPRDRRCPRLAVGPLAAVIVEFAGRERAAACSFAGFLVTIIAMRDEDLSKLAARAANWLRPPRD